ncbi:MAG: type II toxin-antitoxin system PemK/MazF family toxin [Bacteroidota bacterium]|nr:type II toxin-antitoxin system PemK/MazF family toxin [Bacteroidota bacterium]
MRKTGQIILVRYPQTDFIEGKLRPALLLSKVPGNYKDWLLCMISTKEKQLLSEIDEIINNDSEDFKMSGLKSESVIRIFRLAVVSEEILLGSIGEISGDRLKRIKDKIAEWVRN